MAEAADQPKSPVTPSGYVTVTLANGHQSVRQNVSDVKDAEQLLKRQQTLIIPWMK